MRSCQFTVFQAPVTGIIMVKKSVHEGGRKVVLVGMVIFILTGCDGFLAYHLRDAELEESLKRSKPMFNRLVRMADENPDVARIASDFYKLGSNDSEPIWEACSRFPKARWDEYRELFRTLNLKNGMMRLSEYPGVLFLLPVHNEHTVFDEKGYAYSSRPLAPLRDSLDDPSAVKSGFGFKYLKENWYLFAIAKP